MTHDTLNYKAFYLISTHRKKNIYSRILPDEVLGGQLQEGVAHVVDLGIGGHLGCRSKGPAGATHALHT
jgi:hypothetical protein